MANRRFDGMVSLLPGGESVTQVTDEGLIINKIFELYPGKTVFLDLEQLDERAENALQRQRRRRFYLRNGFYYTGMGLHYYGVDYELLSSSRQGETEKFKEIAEYLRPKGFKVTYSRLNY